MKILPVTINNYNQLYQSNPPKYQKISQPAFCGQDTFKTGSILDSEINNIKEELKATVDPYKIKYKDKFIQIGKIGYASQEKLKLAKEYQKQMFEKQFNATNNDTFKKIEKVTDLYKNYTQGINNFERTAEFIQSREIYSTPQLLNAIEKNRPKIYRDKEEFEKIKPLYNKYQNTKSKIDEELNRLTEKQNTEFAEKRTKLDEQNKEAVFIFLASGYMDMQNIYKDAKSLFADYEQKKYPQYELLQRAEKLNECIDRFKKNLNYSEENQTNWDKFIETNKNYENFPLSTEEIKEKYETNLRTADKIIQKHTQNLEEYYLKNPVKLSPRIVSRALNAQNKGNTRINTRLLTEKEKYIKYIQ